MVEKESGNFVLSLDFELSWGIIEMPYLDNYRKNIVGVHTVIPKLLALADKYDVHLTFGIVGFLYFENQEALLNQLPVEQPSYSRKELSPYKYLKERTLENRTHFAPELIRKIKENGNHEIGSHTFCHYYCQEKGQSLKEFTDDIHHAVNVAKKEEVKLYSLIFPRNQCNGQYLEKCRDVGFICYRGNEMNRFHPDKPQNIIINGFVRFVRFLDTFINITGSNCYSRKTLSIEPIVNIPASRFFRHYSSPLKWLQPLKVKRIKNGMKHAAMNGEIYHLWFHPHNIGYNQDENLKQLEDIFSYYQKLRTQNNFTSVTMSELAKSVKHEN